MSVESSGESVWPLAESEPVGLDIDTTNEAALRYMERGAFHSEQDRVIAGELAGSLVENVRRGIIDSQTYQSALLSLCRLVPFRGEDGRRYIDSRPLTAGAERLIASRLQSPEVDVAGLGGAWGRLPEAVKKELTRWGPPLDMELTLNCTVACSFCSFANKGMITGKASYNSVKEIIRYYATKQVSDGVNTFTDSLFWGTDPFDAKWETEYPGIELGYHDLARDHENMCNSRGRRLFTSTAIPLGEELRVLSFAQYALGSPDDIPHHLLRLSQTQANASRFGHVMAVLEGLQPYGLNRLMVSDVREDTALRGSAWKRPTRPVRLRDITGPNSKDGVVIQVNGITGLVMQGASPERPDGELRFPVEAEPVDGLRQYRIPIYNLRPAFEGDEQYPHCIYPDAGISTLILGEDGSVYKRYVEQNKHDPHRALLRALGALECYTFAIRRGEMSVAEAHDAFQEHFMDSVETVWGYLRSDTGKGVGREVMRSALSTLKKHGYISFPLAQ